MTTTVIYLWGIADDINAAALSIAVAGFIIAGFLLIASFACEAESDKEQSAAAMRGFRKALITGCVALTVTVLAPSSKTIAAMVVIPAIANSDAIKRDLPDIYNAAVNQLKEELGIKSTEEPK